ncbi:hypothetical protein N644_1910 [Lactiplantibacillus paraplantarum]|nr:hypothetical protein N644_1910 [Lactiplantibacillus paraplantarum]
MGGQYLKRGLWLEFVSIMFRQLAETSVDLSWLFLTSDFGRLNNDSC